MHLFGQLLGNLSKGARNLKPQSRNPLHHGFHADAVDRLPDVLFAEADHLSCLGVAGLLRILYLALDGRKFLLTLLLGAPRPGPTLLRLLGCHFGICPVAAGGQKMSNECEIGEEYYVI